MKKQRLPLESQDKAVNQSRKLKPCLILDCFHEQCIHQHITRSGGDQSEPVDRVQKPLIGQWIMTVFGLWHFLFCVCANPRKLNRFLYLTIRRSQGLLVFQYGGGVAAADRQRTISLKRSRDEAQRRQRKNEDLYEGEIYDNNNNVFNFTIKIPYLIIGNERSMKRDLN